MRTLCSLLLVSLALIFLTGFGKRPEFSVRFHTEANAHDSDRFATPVKLKYPPRAAYIEKSPAISERQIASIYPFEAPDGTFGCLFKLDPDGRLALESVTTQHRGTSLIAFVGTKTGVHQVTDMMIDKPVLDGIVTIQSGLTSLEIAALKKKFRPVLPKNSGAKPE